MNANGAFDSDKKKSTKAIQKLYLCRSRHFDDTEGKQQQHFMTTIVSIDPKATV